MSDAQPTDSARAVNPRWPPDLFDVVFIPLTKGKFSAIDASDAGRVFGRRWCAIRREHTFYAATHDRVGGRKLTVYLHRFLCGNPAGTLVDHWDRDGLNNLRRNLRPCTRQQNNWNTKGRNRRRSKFKGVTPTVNGKRWRAQLAIGGKQTYLGTFDTEAAAARRHDEAAVLHHGGFARLNFPAQPSEGA